MVEWMIYGANGYMGDLIAREAKARGLQPILAGRNARALSRLGQELGCEVRIFDLTDPAAIVQQLRGVAAVLHCAGPFSATSLPMLDACMRTGTHYLDITGEIAVFEAIFHRAEELTHARIVALPGVGFDVVPTDCLAALLKRELSDATHLLLAFASRYGRASRGTLKSSLEAAAQGCKIRWDGDIIVVPPKLTRIPFGDQDLPAIRIPWGDVSTAYYSTGIPTIEVYVGGTRLVGQVQSLYRLRRLFKTGLIQAMFKEVIGWTRTGPNEVERANDEYLLWGKVTNAGGDQVVMKLSTPEGYNVTKDAAVTAVVTLLERDLPPGAYTPSLAFGPEFVLGLHGVVAPTKSGTDKAEKA
jgi:short subunit dehydrogenase-like uncharacterized protein